MIRITYINIHTHLEKESLANKDVCVWKRKSSLISDGHKSRRKATSWIFLGFKSEFKIDFAVIAWYPALFGTDSYDEQIVHAIRQSLEIYLLNDVNSLIIRKIITILFIEKYPSCLTYIKYCIERLFLNDIEY